MVLDLIWRALQKNMQTSTRNRLVYFRVSQEEFQELSRERERSGARSLSEMARLAVLRFSEHHRIMSGAVLTETLQDLAKQVQHLNRMMTELVGNRDSGDRWENDDVAEKCEADCE